MAVSEKKKISNARWDKENMAIISVKMRDRVKGAFREACEQNGTTMNAVLLETIRKYIEQNRKEQN